MTLTELIEALRARSPGAMELVREINRINGEELARRQMERLELRFRADRERLMRHKEQTDKGAQ